MGTYGFLRISLPILPEAWQQWQVFIAVLAVVSIIYGAFVAFAQTDLKKLVAYSSVSHMGFAMLGIAAGTAVGLDGTQAVNISHGLLSAMLFLSVGMVYERSHTRRIAEVSGLIAKMPVLAGLLAFAAFASLGLPGLSGFVGEFLSLLGAWDSSCGRIHGARSDRRAARCGLHVVDGPACDPRRALRVDQGRARGLGA